MVAILKNKKIWIGIFAPILAQLLILYILLPAVNDTDKKLDNLSIAVVNNDAVLGNEIIQNLKGNLPFTIKLVEDKAKALDDMENGSYQMVIDIPSTFSQDLQNSTSALHFYINQAVPPTVKTAMEQVAKQITEKLNTNIFDMKKGKLQNAIKQGLSQQPNQNNESVKQLLSNAFSSLTITQVQGNINKINNNDGIIYSVLPLELFLTTFIAALLMASIHFKEFLSMTEIGSRWKKFWSNQLINLMGAVIFPIGSWLILLSFDINLAISKAEFWFFMSLCFYTFLLFSQLFIYLFGVIGQGLTGLLILIQIVSCGLILPSQFLPSVYKGLGAILPGVAFSEGIYRAVFGGLSLSDSMIELIIFASCFLLLLLIVVYSRKNLYKRA